MVPFAGAISLGVSAASTAGTVAVAKVRIARYLERANKGYFHQRGLAARIAKQSTLPQIVHQPPGSPLLAPIPSFASPDSFPSLRDRRVQALGNYIAPLHFEPSSDVSSEKNWLDKMSAKVAARSAAKSERKMVKNHMKDREDELEEQAKLHEELDKARRKGKSSKIAKAEAELHANQEMLLHGSGKSAEKEQKAANKFLFVVIQGIEEAKAAAAAAAGDDVPNSLK